ncbi:MAG TPA: Rrf2 family transcriptional regulator [Usitatibacter sp.]|nr:Rrf2 family transcriptional regulator [Usitatibacter sp.]
MRLTTFTDYALRVLLHAATAPEGRTTIGAVASAYRISANHLVKVVNLLGKEGFLYNARGRHGGLRLSVSPSAINVGSVVRATEGPSVLAECFEKEGACVIDGACRLQRILREADEAFFEVLDHYTLQDLLLRPGRMAAILHSHELALPGGTQ